MTRRSNHTLESPNYYFSTPKKKPTKTGHIPTNSDSQPIGHNPTTNLYPPKTLTLRLTIVAKSQL